MWGIIILVIVVIVIYLIYKNKDEFDGKGRKFNSQAGYKGRVQRCGNFDSLGYGSCDGIPCTSCSRFLPLDLDCKNYSASCDYENYLYCHKCDRFESKSE